MRGENEDGLRVSGRGCAHFREPYVFGVGKASRQGEAHTRKLAGGEEPRQEEVSVLASESPERLEQLREGFLRALSDLSGGPGEGKQAMISEVARGAGLDPEGDPEDRALGERLAAELVPRASPRPRRDPAASWAITPEGSGRSGAPAEAGPPDL
jgi:hypothetical protein